MSFPVLNQDFTDILIALEEEQVAFLVVGAFAVAINGAPRYTGDLDLWVRPDTENAHRTLRALIRFGAPLSTHGLHVDDLSHPGAVYQMGLPPRRIDVLTKIDGVTFEEAWPNRIEATVGGLHMAFLGLRELVRNKRAAGRPKDLLDIELLREAGVIVDEER